MQIQCVGIVGCGTMGSGIAQVCSQAKYNVIVYESTEELIDQGFKRIRAFLNKGIEKGKLTEKGREEILERIARSTTLSSLKDCELIIEAVPESLDLKKKIFSALDSLCSPQTIFASNTSTLSITEIARATHHPGRVLGMHFFNPAPLMRLLELVRSLFTEPEVMETAKAFGESLGKTVIVAKDTPGFIVNYLQLPFRLNAIRMVENRLASPEDIDLAATLGLGHPMGPLALQDLVGLDVTLAAAQSIYEATGDPRFKPPVLMQRMVAAGWLGRKTGKGFYEYCSKNVSKNMK